MVKLEELICKDCDFNYVVSDENGVMQYCAILEIYEDEMKLIEKCEHYRKDKEYKKK